MPTPPVITIAPLVVELDVVEFVITIGLEVVNPPPPSDTKGKSKTTVPFCPFDGYNRG